MVNVNPIAESAPSPSSHPLVPPGPAEYRGLDEFCRRNPSQFQGGFAPDADIEWIQGVERIFRAMNCSEAQKLAYATYMLVTEVEDYSKLWLKRCSKVCLKRCSKLCLKRCSKLWVKRCSKLWVKRCSKLWLKRCSKLWLKLCSKLWLKQCSKIWLKLCSMIFKRKVYFS
ncbi:hypothetical protein Lal_00037325 [Lupinus albus]|nr:hypothetical protein Lal_00037325 [Lupinus albus]